LDGQRENVRWKCGGSRFYNAAAVVRRAVKNGCHAVAQRWRQARKVGSIPKGLPSIHYPHLSDYRLPVARQLYIIIRAPRRIGFRLKHGRW